MIHKRFKYEPVEILNYSFSASANVFTVHLRNNAVIHYQPKSPEVFLQWLEDSGIPVKERRFKIL